MEFRILGPLEVRADDGLLALGGAKPRALLAALVLHPNEPISAERLAVSLWGEEAPAGAVKTVQVHVSRLRKALGDPDRLVTTPAGYRLRVDPGELDADRFEQLSQDGRRALADGQPERAASALRDALSLWRGHALADLAFESFAQHEIQRLDEQRLEALETRLEADLAAGRHAELVGELQRLVGEHPLRERFRGQLMLALYRAGRQADALQAYRSARDALVEQLGVEPSDALRQLEQAILSHGAELASPPPAARPHYRLPALPNRTIGRTHELDAIVARLCDRSVRLLTLTGPGGVGKTRLALEAARALEQDFADGACFVSLAALHRPADVPAAIVKVLEIAVLAGESPEGAVERFLAAKQLLLIADNFEHLLAAAPFIGELLGSCRALTVLATSREPLALRAEERYPVSPLALPETRTAQGRKALADSDAVALFRQRARAHDPEFELDDTNADAVAEICRRVDGLPLAIELAAARCGLLSPAEIADRLEAALAAPGIRGRDAPARQQTLRATIDWSHNLLDDAERRCFARFAVFAGGAMVVAAEAIIGADIDTLDRLVAQSLLTRQARPGGETRLTMLATIRAHALERLAGLPDAAAVRQRHCRDFRALAERHGSDRELEGARRTEHLERLDADIENLHAALAWAVNERQAEPALALCAALGRYWLMRNRHADAVHWIGRALEVAEPEAHAGLRARVLDIKARALWPLGRAAEHQSAAKESESIARKLGEPSLLSQVLCSRSMQEGAAGSLDVADRLADEALRWAQVSGDDWAIAMAASALARAARSAEELRTRVDAAATLLERVGNLYQLARLLSAATYIALIHGSAQDARVFADRAAPLIQRLEDPQTAMFFAGNAGLAALFAGDAEAARAAFREQLRLCRALVYLPASEGLSGLAAVAAVDGDFERAARLRGAAGAHRYGEPIDAVDARLQTAYFEPARRQHGPDAWHAAERQGAALSVEDAIAYGLEETQSQPTASCPIPHRNHDIDGPLFVPVTPGHARFSRQRPSA